MTEKSLSSQNETLNTDEEVVKDSTSKKKSSIVKKVSIIGVLVLIALFVVLFSLNQNGQPSTSQSSDSNAPSMLDQFNNGSLVYYSPSIMNTATSSGEPLWATGFLVVCQDENEIEHVSVYPETDPNHCVPNAGVGNDEIDLDNSDLEEALIVTQQDGYTYYFFEPPFETRQGIQLGSKTFKLSSASTQARNDIMEGHGYDAEWIRQYPDMVENLQLHNGIDINDSYWDTHRLLSAYVCYPSESSAAEIGWEYKFALVNKNTYWQINPTTNLSDAKSLEEIDSMLAAEQYQTLSEAIQLNQYGGTRELLAFS